MTAQSLPSPDDVRSAIRYGDLAYSNPHGQIVHPRWAGGEIVYSIPLGPVAIDVSKTKVAEEHLRLEAGRRHVQPHLAPQPRDRAARLRPSDPPLRSGRAQERVSGSQYGQIHELTRPLGRACPATTE